MGEMVELDAHYTTIGRGLTATVRINDEGISRTHAAVTVDKGVYYLSDAGSTNGTFVNSQRLQGSASIGAYDEVYICHIRMEIAVGNQEFPPVQVPGAEGRAGMAAVVMESGCLFDPVAFFRHAAERLPRYAAPLFVRVAPVADMTTTFKLRKVDLQREGFDSAQVADPLFVRDEQARRYVPLTPEAVARALAASN